jgi:cytochrome c-type biogenesis protein CcmE
MNAKMIAGTAIIVVFIVFGAYSFLDTNVEYTDIAGAMAKGKKVQLKGTWNKERESGFNASTGKFSFYLVDDAGKECQVILDGAAPNNFEIATSVVAKGRYNAAGYFQASEVLTKCPSKYEAKSIEQGKTSP